MRRIIFIFSFYDIFKLLCPFKPFFSPCRAKSLMYIYKLILHASLTLSLSYTHTHTHLKTISKGCPSFCKIFSTQLFCLFIYFFFPSCNSPVLYQTQPFRRIPGPKSYSLGLSSHAACGSTSCLSLGRGLTHWGLVTQLVSIQLGQVLTAGNSLLVPNQSTIHCHSNLFS